MITVVSYGSGHNDPPKGVDLVFPVAHRFRDPHMDPELKLLTGLDSRVMHSVMKQPGAEVFLRRSIYAISSMYSPLGPPLTVAYECIGGRHRSVVFAQHAGKHLAGLSYEVEIVHRHIMREVIRR